MAAPSLSTVLTNANLTMYQSTAPELLQPQQLERMSPAFMGNISPAPGQWYEQLSPQCWTPENVLDWISDSIEGTNFDARSLNLSYCAVDGPSLCMMSQQDMMGLFGPQLGALLYHSLLKHKARPVNQYLPEPETELDETCQLLHNFLDKLDYPFLSTLTIGQSINNDGLALKKEPSFYEYELGLGMEQIPPFSDSGYFSDQHSDSELSSSSNSCVFASLHTPESTSGESDPEFSYPTISKIKMEKSGEDCCQKRPRGRPPKGSRDHNNLYTSPKKSKHAPRGSHLWEFIRDILVHPEKNPGLLKWEDRREGVFKFLKSEAVAQMWGQKKKNSSMTYEKLSRAMRYYYKRDILERVDGRRLVYKFGKNASGWRTSEL